MRGLGIGRDTQGALYIAGQFTGELSVGDSHLSSKGGTDVFVAKLDSLGNPLWAKQAGFLFDDSCTGATVDRRGNFIFTGWFTGSALFDDQLLRAQGAQEIFIAKIGAESVMPPEIVMDPLDQAELIGGRAVFAVDSAGSLPLEYQWFFNGVALATATNSQWVVDRVGQLDQGDYQVLIRNEAGSVSSRVARLSIAYTPTIVNGPLSQQAPPGAEVSLDVEAQGTAPLRYQWQFNANDLIGATDRLLTMTNVVVGQTGSYRVRVVNDYGSVTSAAVNVYVQALLSIEVEGEGTVERSPDQPFYLPGDALRLTAVAARWFEFKGWSDGVSDRVRQVTIALTNQYRALFEATTPVEQLTLGGTRRIAPVGMPALIADGEFVTGGSVVRSNRSQITLLSSFENGWIFYTLDGSAPTVGAHLYEGPFAVGRTETIRAIGYDGLLILGWEMDPARVEIVAAFEVSARSAGGGKAEASPGMSLYASNSVAVLRAAADPGWTFLGWVGDATGSQEATLLRVTGPTCAEALFGTSLSGVSAGQGSVKREPELPWYRYGSEVKLWAKPGQGYRFAAWGDGIKGTNALLKLIVTNAEMSVTGLFVPLEPGEASLTVAVKGAGWVEQNPKGSHFAKGKRVRLKAKADPGQEFEGWFVDGQGVESEIEVITDRSKVIEARFTRKPRLEVAPCRGGFRPEGFRYSVVGDAGQTYGIMLSLDGQQWIQGPTATNAFGITTLIDPTARIPSKYYRGISAE
ncbi:MAG: chitobiase/beta-hexosaminidase C-terminal domain-containing protein [Verrucomicrobia bacterium]|nr:chitobiase/beta-hexosaminidase C-terminal domain-containing protein [Verrucomicrobiota bacterium]MBI3866957.1 chitobiase/beta-hexosaminidase C-terminal domain-containing protein [Verrucomicrobiota bacterium]